MKHVLVLRKKRPNESSFVFHRLARDFQDTRAELRELVEEQDTSAGERDFAELGNIASTDQPCM